MASRMLSNPAPKRGVFGHLATMAAIAEASGYRASVGDNDHLVILNNASKPPKQQKPPKPQGEVDDDPTAPYVKADRAQKKFHAAIAALHAHQALTPCDAKIEAKLLDALHTAQNEYEDARSKRQDHSAAKYITPKKTSISTQQA